MKRGNAGRSRPPPLPDTLPDRAAVESAIETILDRLRPKPVRVPRADAARKTGPVRKDG
ncbi:hypothetical protein [Methylobacterium sp. NEAU K]|uniref:hypothetical protein n=1 Tax=Methylobacterium sp. NEAU K TaxID=3064946 RepID=UPI0027342724|nr:hypothetical protein [Methylobacterium sp. NEAU K]MDP4005375.1 hypothetical protein [Methylobacterium sp. NEAU K]